MYKNLPSNKTTIAIVIGNALEWYDFIIYSFMTVYIAKLFFPTANPVYSLLAAMATFGVAFYVRPFGGILLGILADKKGRKCAITTIIALMTGAIFLIAVTPTYAQIGIFASIIMVFARLLQGFSAGGEFATATAMLMELSPAEHRGFYCSWQIVGQLFAIMIGTLIGTLLTTILSPNQIESWGWRLPFILGLLIMPIGIYIRMHLAETHIDDAIHPSHIVFKLRHHFWQIVLCFGLVIGGTVTTYINFIYMPTFMNIYFGVPLNLTFIVVLLGAFVTLSFTPIFGALSDRIGRKKLLLASLSAYILLIYPLFFWLLHSPIFSTLVIVQIIVCFILSAYFGVYVAIVSEQFPKEIRSTAISISYNLVVMLFGGFAQFIVTWLIEQIKTPFALVYYLLFAMVMTFIAALFYQENTRVIS